MAGINIVKKSVALFLIAILLSGLLSVAVLFLSACKNDSPVESNVILRDGRVTVKWGAVKDAKEYRVYYAPSRFSEYNLESTQKKTEFKGEDIYGYYRVDAVDKQGTVIASETYSYETQLFGNNVGVYSPLDDTSAVQGELDEFCKKTDEFYDGRFAAIFKAGDYNQLDLQLRYYTTYSGLGKLPTDTVLGKLNVYATQPGGNATRDFWRGIENLTINDNVQWAVSQATSFRRMKVNGSMTLVDRGETPWASGGYISDTVVTDTIDSGGQQQWFTRNSEWNNWRGSDINMVFSGCNGNFDGNDYSWPTRRVTMLDTTEVIREKPYLVFDNGYYVCKPALQRDSKGVSWQGNDMQAEYIPLEKFYVARADKDNADTLNKALSSGKHLLLTPGIYVLDDPLEVKSENTVVLGLGLATLKLSEYNGDTAIRIADEDGITVSGILIDAGEYSESLMEVGEKDKNHANNPSVLHDIYFRIGGAVSSETAVDSALIINSNNVISDNLWIWRADHGIDCPVGWELNKASNGIMVNGDHVTAYALMVEHFQEYQTVWNGENGTTVFYQSETPYDPPKQSDWMSKWNGVEYFGYASYKVSDKVQNHRLYGAGVYYVASSQLENVFDLDHGIELPSNSGIHAEHMAIANFNTYGGGIRHIVNQYGESLFVSNGSKRQFTSFIAGVAKY